MKHYKKKELLQIVATLSKANDIILKSIKSNSSDAMEVLISCQETAIQMGTYIDALDEKYGYLVRLLEDYCENVYQISVAVADENICRKIVKRIQKQLSQLSNGFRCELPDDRKEVVFLPYKASMWDSLESVWKEAEDDGNCDVYVIPIPYFDKNPDGTFREEHYEGNQYPEYVPITHYKEYDFDERKPDVIYIHNPYDDYNMVTSVHPYFYSKNLKKFTDTLIYIPYFVLAEIEPDNREGVEGIRHFCTVQGVFSADKVIVQSEKMRQIYIDVLTEEMGGTKEARKYWERKIDGSGSPKLNKVANTRREDIEISLEWMEIINKPDGTPKKIIFYNNSIGAFLENSEEMITKLQSVLQTFKNNKDEVALLWRPHPLLESTLKSMRPYLLDAYREIKDKYLNEEWGIYDDTPDIDRAIVMSDAYYGDPSSVVQMYQQTGKPIMIQKV